MKFSIKDLFSKCDQIRRKLRIWSYLPKKFLMENFIFCAVAYEHIHLILWDEVHIEPILKLMDLLANLFTTYLLLNIFSSTNMEANLIQTEKISSNFMRQSCKFTSHVIIS